MGEIGQFIILVALGVALSPLICLLIITIKTCDTNKDVKKLVEILEEADSKEKS